VLEEGGECLESLGNGATPGREVDSGTLSRANDETVTRSKCEPGRKRLASPLETKSRKNQSSPGLASD